MKNISKRLLAMVLAVGLLFTACGDGAEDSETITEEEFAQAVLQEELTNAGLNDTQKENLLQVFAELGGTPAQLTDFLFVPDEGLLTAQFDEFYTLQFMFDGNKVHEVSCVYSSELHYYLFYMDGTIEADFRTLLVQHDERLAIQSVILSELQNAYPDVTITESSREYISYWHYDKLDNRGDAEADQSTSHYIVFATLDATFEDGTVMTMHVQSQLVEKDGVWNVKSLWFGKQNEGEEEIKETVTVIEALEE